MRVLRKIKRSLKSLGSEEEGSPQNKSVASPGRLSTELGPTGPRILHEGENAIVDIVFIHGLTGGRDRTWSATDTGDPWPLLLLSEDLPNVRLITYGYDADVVHWTRPAGQATIREHSKNLVQDLGNVRRTPPATVGRPIIFVVHSLGGLVCEDAIFFCNNAINDSQEDFLASVHGVVFFGTPHAGSDFTKFATAISDIISLSIVKKPNRTLLDVLKKNSEMLANIENDFFTLIRNRSKSGKKPIDLFVFVEELPLAATGRRVVESSSAVIKGYDSGTIHADHMGITKFATRDNQYRRVLGLLTEWVEQIKANQVKLTCEIPPKDRVQEYGKPPDRNDPHLGSEKYFSYPSVAKFHINRRKLRDEIDDAFSRREDGRPTIVVLEGQGGQGKTQLAINYCHHSYVTRSRFQAIFWLDASSETALQRSLVSISDTVKMEDHIFDNDAARVRYTLDKIRYWNRDWLLVFDNFDKPKELTNLERDYIPASGYGSVLVTSRHRNLHELGTVIPIPPMDPEESLGLLLAASRLQHEGSISPDQERFATSIVESLGYLPLAVHQAGAFIRRRRLPLAEFINVYETRKESIWREKPAIWSYKGTVYTTWELSFDQIDPNTKRRSERGAILTMLAFLDFRRVSSEIFRIPRVTKSEERAIRGENAPWPDFLLDQSGNWDLFHLEELVRDLHDLCLLSVTSTANRRTLIISLHPLVAEWVKYRTTVTIEKKLEYLTHAFLLVKSCLKAVGEGKASRWISQEAQDEILKHEAACRRSRDELAHKAQDKETAARIEALAGEFNDLNGPNRISDNVTMEYLTTGVHQLRNDRSQQAHTNILNWLSSSSMDSIHESHASRRRAGTCEWIFNVPNYRQWVENEHNVLFCFGNAGTGKTLIASKVIDELRNSQKDDKTAVTFFYFDSISTRSTAVEFISSIIRQLLTPLGAIPDNIVEIYRTSTLARPALPEAIQLLKAFDEIYSTIFIVVDAIDEPLEEERRHIFEIIDQLVLQPSPFKLYITSRPRADISPMASGLGPSINLDHHISEVTDDISRVVSEILLSDSWMARFLDEQMREEVVTTLSQRSDGMFLWTQLQLDNLKGAATKQHAREILHSGPRSLHEMYRRMLDPIVNNVNPRRRNLAYAVFAWLLRAQRPLTVRELVFALIYDKRNKEFFGIQAEEEDIISSCADLVVVDSETRVVSFSHVSVREFLAHEESMGHLKLPFNHAEISLACMTCINISAIRGSVGDTTALFPLLSYSATYWAFHARFQEEPETISETLRDIVWRNTWFQVLQFNRVRSISNGFWDIGVTELRGMSELQIALALRLENTAMFLSSAS